MPINEPNSGAAPGGSYSTPTSYKDRSAGLTVFGVLTIMLGCLIGLFIPLMFFGQAMSAKATGVPPNSLALLPTISLYGTLAVALVWLGIGSIQARRWARALLLIFSWSWLIMGVFLVLFTIILVPRMIANLSTTGTSGHPAAPAAAMGVVMIFMVAILGFFFIILPAIWTFFYSSRHVKTTCEMRDPVTRWTDACPLPVLGLSLWLAFAVPMLLIMPLAGKAVMPFFGMFFSGASGGVFCLLMAGIWSYAAWSLYKLERRGWWLILIALCVFMVSALVTFARHDVMEMYRLMGYSEAQMEQLQKFSIVSGKGMMWLMVLCMAPFLVYLLSIRRYLFRAA